MKLSSDCLVMIFESCCKHRFRDSRVTQKEANYGGAIPSG